MPDPTGPVTRGGLVREDKLLWVYCDECCHERDINPATAETPVPEIGKRIKCSNCGSGNITTAPELCPGGIHAMRRRFRENPPTR